MLYPEGWRYREFVGNFRASPPGKAAKRFKANGNNVVDQVMHEEEQLKQDEISRLRQEVEQLRQLSGATGGAAVQGQGMQQ